MDAVEFFRIIKKMCVNVKCSECGCSALCTRPPVLIKEEDVAAAVMAAEKYEKENEYGRQRTD